MSIDRTVWPNVNQKEDIRSAVFMILLLLAAYTVSIKMSAGEFPFYAFLPGLALLIVSTLSFELSSLLLVASLFVNLSFSALSFAGWFTLPFGLAFLWRFKDFRWREFSNPLTSAILVYGVCITPSLINAPRLDVSLLMMLNVVAFLIVVFALLAGLRTHKDVLRIAVAYLVCVLIGSADVIVLGMSGQNRPFGFAGIWFVDYSALGVCLSVAIAIVSEGRARLLSIIASVLSGAALVLTQTRSTWASAIITLVVLVVVLFWKPELIGVRRQRILVPIALEAIIMVAVVILTFGTNPNIGKRAIQFEKQPGLGINRQGNVENSLGSRLLIWDTAINAFKAHPLFGIGVYQFRFVSRTYSDLPRFLYDRFVAKLPTHQTHLAVLSETGIVGFAGFLLFIYVLLRTSVQSVVRAKDDRTRRYALVAAVAVAYCLVSMFITDAWLWGQQIVLLGIVIGTMLAIPKIAERQRTRNA